MEVEITIDFDIPVACKPELPERNFHSLEKKMEKNCAPFPSKHI